ncbi:hypothetical protein AB1K84_14115 [Mesobacillus foraminis]|jgi:hypothetical protein|uniref:hypothetical protein n=1 Tax=Mesobacillus foraminis TaxID=279826 RepID=UPI000EF55636|nr:hypothetical protein [Mesobacillus foraminis]MBT2758261.1 hypothetical protein [Mesobacillus foraminis]
MQDMRRPFYGGFGRRRFFWGGPFVGGLLGGLVGSALLYPRPYYPFYPPYPYPYYGGYPYWY